MAACDWEVVAFDLNGPCIGIESNRDDATLEIHKNRLYIHDDKRRGKIEVQVWDGALTYGAWQIHAQRGPQQGIYVVAYSHRFDLETRQWVDRCLLVGAGVYGYTNPSDTYQGDGPVVAITGFDETCGWATNLVGVHDDELVVLEENVKPPIWVGLQPESLDYLKTMVGDIARGCDEWLAQQLAVIPWDQRPHTTTSDTPKELNG